MEPTGRARPAEEPPAPPPAPGPTGPWVLVCDDTSSIRLLIRINLELAGFEVLEAGDGEAALELLRRHRDWPPAVVTLDAQMSPLDGWGAVAQIRADPRTHDLPVVMVTASLLRHERERAAASGVDAFLAKPFEPVDLVDTVQGLAVAGREDGGRAPRL